MQLFFLVLMRAPEMRSDLERGRTFCECARRARLCGGLLPRARPVNATGGPHFGSSTIH